MTTANAYELQNIEKCLKAGIDEVSLISENKEKLEQIKTEMGHKPKVWFFSKSDLEAELVARTPRPLTETITIRGREVEIITAYTPDDEREIRAERIKYILSKVKK